MGTPCTCYSSASSFPFVDGRIGCGSFGWVETIRSVTPHSDRSEWTDSSRAIATEESFWCQVDIRGYSMDGGMSISLIMHDVRYRDDTTLLCIPATQCSHSNLSPQPGMIISSVSHDFNLLQPKNEIRYDIDGPLGSVLFEIPRGKSQSRLSVSR